nr:hypothetical protein Iba_scaffold55742CG0010 [Ipomoea batatas]
MIYPCSCIQKTFGLISHISIYMGYLKLDSMLSSLQLLQDCLSGGMLLVVQQMKVLGIFYQIEHFLTLLRRCLLPATDCSSWLNQSTHITHLLKIMLII